MRETRRLESARGQSALTRERHVVSSKKSVCTQIRVRFSKRRESCLHSARSLSRSSKAEDAWIRTLEVDVVDEVRDLPNERFAFPDSRLVPKARFLKSPIRTSETRTKGSFQLRFGLRTVRTRAWSVSFQNTLNMSKARHHDSRTRTRILHRIDAAYEASKSFAWPRRVCSAFANSARSREADAADRRSIADTDSNESLREKRPYFLRESAQGFAVKERRRDPFLRFRFGDDAHVFRSIDRASFAIDRDLSRIARGARETARGVLAYDPTDGDASSRKPSMGTLLNSSTRFATMGDFQRTRKGPCHYRALSICPKPDTQVSPTDQNVQCTRFKRFARKPRHSLVSSARSGRMQESQRTLCTCRVSL